jgi:hypothetical protein
LEGLDFSRQRWRDRLMCCSQHHKQPPRIGHCAAKCDASNPVTFVRREPTKIAILRTSSCIVQVPGERDSAVLSRDTNVIHTPSIHASPQSHMGPGSIRENMM